MCSGFCSCCISNWKINYLFFFSFGIHRGLGTVNVYTLNRPGWLSHWCLRVFLLVLSENKRPDCFQGACYVFELKELSFTLLQHLIKAHILTSVWICNHIVLDLFSHSHSSSFLFTLFLLTGYKAYWSCPWPIFCFLFTPWSSWPLLALPCILSNFIARGKLRQHFVDVLLSEDTNWKIDSAAALCLSEL